jgi:hypothetical protein
MRTCTGAILAGLLLALAPARITAQKTEEGGTVAAQKKAGAANWSVVVESPPAFHETPHLLVFAPKTMEKRLKGVGALLEKYHDRAVKQLAFDAKGREMYPGKITVYLFSDREHVPAFARRVEKRRPMDGESASFSATDDRLHAAAAPAGKRISVEARAGEQIASLLMARKAGKGTALPEWVLGGFGRATSSRLLPREKFVVEERRQARALSSKRKASDVWSGAVDADEADALSGSVMDFLAYGPGGAARLPKIIAGFAPEEGIPTKTAAQALEAARIKVETVEKAWRTWVVNPR